MASLLLEIDADVSAILYTIVADFFVFLICYILWILVSDNQPLATSVFLPHTWKYKVIAHNLYSASSSWLSCDWLDSPLCCCRRPQRATEAEQDQARSAVADVTVEPGTEVAAQQEYAAIMQRRTSESTRTKVAPVSDPTEGHVYAAVATGPTPLMVRSHSSSVLDEAKRPDSVESAHTPVVGPHPAPVHEVPYAPEQTIFEKGSEVIATQTTPSQRTRQLLAVGAEPLAVDIARARSSSPRSSRTSAPPSPISPATESYLARTREIHAAAAEAHVGHAAHAAHAAHAHVSADGHLSVDFGSTLPIPRASGHARSNSNTSVASSVASSNASSTQAPIRRLPTIQEALGTVQPIVQVLRKDSQPAPPVVPVEQRRKPSAAEDEEPPVVTSPPTKLRLFTGSPAAGNAAAIRILEEDVKPKSPASRGGVEAGMPMIELTTPTAAAASSTAAIASSASAIPAAASAAAAVDGAGATHQRRNSAGDGLRVVTSGPSFSPVATSDQPPRKASTPEAVAGGDAQSNVDAVLSPPASATSPPASESEVNLADATHGASASSTVMIVPVQEDVQISDQTFVTPPRSKMRFYLVEPLLEKVFPRIRLLGANAVDAFIYLKFAQLLIVVMSVMTLVCCCVLIPIHTHLNVDSAATVFVAASIASVPPRSQWFLAHFLVAFFFLILLYAYVRLLTSHAVKATKLSTVITDDKETIASRRTVHIKSMALDYVSEEALKGEIIRLLPVNKQSQGDIEILHVSLFHDVTPIVEIFAKKEKVLDEIERLEILASQVQMNPTAKIKKVWLKVLHAPGLMSVKSRLERLRLKRAALTLAVVDRIYNYYQLTCDPGVDENGAPILAPVMAYPPLQAGSPPAASTSKSAAKKRGAFHIPGAPSFTDAVPNLIRKVKDFTAGTVTFTGQAFVSFRASAMAGEVIKKHRETRTTIRLKLDHFGVHKRHGPSTKSAGMTPYSPGFVVPTPFSGSQPSGGGGASANDARSPGVVPASATSALGRLMGLVSPFGSPGAGPNGKKKYQCETHRDWNISFAPKPRDILWDNLAAQENIVTSVGRWLIANSSLFFLILFVGVPALILNQITAIINSQTGNLDPTQSVGARVLLFITSYMTSLISWVVSSFYSPYILTSALDFECHPTKSSYAASRFFKSSLLSLINVIIIPVFALTTIGDLLGKLHPQGNSETWYQLLGNSFFTNSGVYFCQYMIHQSLVSFGFNLLDLPTYLRRVWALRTALTKSDFEKAREPPTAGMPYDRLVCIFGLVLWNAISVPHLTPFGLMFFIVQYAIDVYNFRRFKISPANNKGIIPTMAARYTLLYLMGWEFLMAALFFVQNVSSYYLFGVFFTVFGFATLSIYLLREFSTHVPIELHISALKHLDEKITMFAAIGKVMPHLRTESMSLSHVVGANASKLANESDLEEEDDEAVEDEIDLTRIVDARTAHLAQEASLKRRVTFNTREAAVLRRQSSTVGNAQLRPGVDHDHLAVPGGPPGPPASLTPAASPSIPATPNVSPSPGGPSISPDGLAPPSRSQHLSPGIDGRTLTSPSVQPDERSILLTPPPESTVGVPPSAPSPAVGRPPVSVQAPTPSAASSPALHNHSPVAQAAIQRVRHMALGIMAARRLKNRGAGAGGAAGGVDGKKSTRKRPRARSEMHRYSLEYYSDLLKLAFSHPHIHRPPLVHTRSHSHMAHAQMLHLSSVDQSVCPDCLYRHPIWGKIEKDEDIMAILKQREDELIAIQQEEVAIAEMNAEIEADNACTYLSRHDDDGYAMELATDDDQSISRAASSKAPTTPFKAVTPYVSEDEDDDEDEPAPHFIEEEAPPVRVVSTPAAATVNVSGATPALSASNPAPPSEEADDAIPDIVIHLDPLLDQEATVDQAEATSSKAVKPPVEIEDETPSKKA